MSQEASKLNGVCNSYRVILLSLSPEVGNKSPWRRKDLLQNAVLCSFHFIVLRTRLYDLRDFGREEKWFWGSVILGNVTSLMFDVSHLLSLTHWVNPCIMSLVRSHEAHFIDGEYLVICTRSPCDRDTRLKIIQFQLLNIKWGWSSLSLLTLATSGWKLLVCLHTVFVLLDWAHDQGA